MMMFLKIYLMDVVFDAMDDVSEDIATNKRYAGNEKWIVSEVVKCVEEDFGKIDVFVYFLVNGLEVVKFLFETSRKGYLVVISAFFYFNVFMI